MSSSKSKNPKKQTMKIESDDDTLAEDLMNMNFVSMKPSSSRGGGSSQTKDKTKYGDTMPRQEDGPLSAAVIGYIMSSGPSDGTKYVEDAEKAIEICISRRKFTQLDFAKFMVGTKTFDMKNVERQVRENQQKTIDQLGEKGKETATYKKQEEMLSVWIKVAEGLEWAIRDMSLNPKLLTWGTLTRTEFSVTMGKSIRTELKRSIKSRANAMKHTKFLANVSTVTEYMAIFKKPWNCAMQAINALKSDGALVDRVSKTNHKGQRTTVTLWEILDDRVKDYMIDEELSSDATYEEVLEENSVPELLQAGSVPKFHLLFQCSDFRQDPNNETEIKKIMGLMENVILAAGMSVPAGDYNPRLIDDGFRVIYNQAWSKLSQSWTLIINQVSRRRGGANTKALTKSVRYDPKK